MFYLFQQAPRLFFFMLNSTEHEISNAHKNLKYRQITMFLVLSPSNVVFIMVMNVKMPIIDGILTFINRINFVFSSVEHEKVYILGARCRFPF